MNVLIHMSHPAHVHLFRNLINKLKSKKHNTFVTAVDKEITSNLLERYNLDYHVVAKHEVNLIRKIYNLFIVTKAMLSLSRRNKVDVLVGLASAPVAFVAKLLSKKSIILDDTEHSSMEILLYRFLANKIITPNCFSKNLGPSQIKYQGYHELAYLHPNYYTPSSEILERLNIGKKSKYFLIRFVSWGANHDRGYKGLSDQSKIELVRLLANHGKVFISSESALPRELKNFKIKAPPTDIHNLIYYANLVITEGATIASESAILGTPVIYVNDLRLGYLQEQEKKYKLVYNLNSGENLMNAVDSFLNDRKFGSGNRNNSRKLVKDSVDLTSFLFANIID